MADRYVFAAPIDGMLYYGVGPYVEFAELTSSVDKDAGTKTFTVSLSAPALSSGVTVFYCTKNGTAQSESYGLGSNYTAAYDSLTFAEGESSKDITITIINNPVVNLDLTFTVNLFNPINANLGTKTTNTCTIVDVDRTGILTVDDSDDSMTNAGLTPMVGDWTTDDTTALQAVLTYVENPANGKFVVYFPTPSVYYRIGYTEIPAAIRQGFTLIGDDSDVYAIKRIDSAGVNYIMNITSTSTDATQGPIAIYKLGFDGNRTGNPSLNEQAHILRFCGNAATAHRLVVRVQDVKFREHINSDCIATVTNVDSHLYQVSGVNVGRDLSTILGGYSRGYWYEIEASNDAGNGSVEVEITSGTGGGGTTSYTSSLTISDSVLEMFEFSGFATGTGGDTLTMKNVTVTKHTGIYGTITNAPGNYVINDCDFSVNSAFQDLYQYHKNTIFTRCTWTIVDYQSSDDAVDSACIHFFWPESGWSDGILKFVDCKWYVDASLVKGTGKLWALRQTGFMNSTYGHQLIIENSSNAYGVLSDDFDYAVGGTTSVSGHKWKIDGGTMNADYFLYIASYIPSDRPWELDISTVTPVTLGAGCTRYLHDWNNNAAAGNILNDGGTILNEGSNYIYAGGTFTDNTLDSQRAITGVADPTTADHGIAGSVYTGDRWHETTTDDYFTATATGYDLGGSQQNTTWVED